MISPVIFDTDHAFKRQNTILLTKKLFIKVSMMRRSRLVLFFKENLCVSARVGKSLAMCSLSEDPR